MKTKLLFLLALCFFATSLAFGQKRTVKGQVLSQTDGEPLLGVAVAEKGTSNGTITDVDGNFSISINGDAVLTISYMGYITQNVKPVGNAPIKVYLEEDNKMLDDVVVIGYGVQRKSDLTGSVASIKADEIKNLSTPDAAASLQGKAAGVQIINGGAPGAGSQIRVRGYGSNSGSLGPLLIVDGVQVDNIQYLDPSNIASMEVLKDAASAAIYGAQAGNGVVIVTTKSGTEGKSSITYSLKASNQSLGKKAELFNAKDYIAYHTYAGRLSEDILKANNYKGQDTDWYDEVFDNSWSLQHNITIQGGSSKGHFMTNLGIVNNDGIVKGNKDTYKRLTAQINADYKLFKWLTVKTNNNIEKWERKALGNGYQSFLNSVVTIDPLTPAYVYSFEDMGKGMEDQWKNPTADFILPHGNVPVPSGYTDENPVWYGTTKYEPDATGNPLAMRDRAHGINSGLTLRGSMEAILAPIEGLTFTSRLGYTISQSNGHDRSEPFWLNGKNAQSKGFSISANTNASHNYQWSNFANYNKSFDKHNVGVMVGMEFRKDYWDNTSVSSRSDEGRILTGDGAPNYNYITNLNDLGKKNLSVSNEPGQRTSLSYFGRLTYNYDNRYSVQANFRRDSFDSSTLSKDARWGNFPSFSAGWTISNEDFFKDLVDKDMVSFLKLRGSWGRNGNVSPLFSSYKYSATIGIGGYYQFNPGAGQITSGGASGRLANPDLKWETSEQVDLGIDARFFEDRLTLGLDWYKKTTEDFLYDISGCDETGGLNQQQNTGRILNQGIDIEIGWKDNIGDFNYGINANFSPLKNEVQEFSSTVARYSEVGISGFNNKMQPTFEVGHKIWYFRGWKYAGVDDKGAALYYDKDGKKTLAPNTEDMQDLGSAMPTFTYGVTLNLEYKGFDLTVFGTGAAGNKIYNLMVSADSPMINGINTYWKNSTKTDDAGNVISRGKYPDMKKVSTDWTFFSSDAAIFNGSFFKFKQIQLGYTLPRAIAKKAMLSDVRFSVSLDDYFTISKYPGADPETSSLNEGASRGYDNGNYPMPKKVVLGVNLTF